MKTKRSWVNTVILVMVLSVVNLFPNAASIVHADYIVQWKDDTTSYIDGEYVDATLADAHPFHYYAVYNWDYVKEGTAALQQVQKENNVTVSSESNFSYYMAMLRAVELGLDGRHSHLSPAHGNLFSQMNVGEVYTGGSDYLDSIESWKNSPAHLSNILNFSSGSMA